jgi:hypothetical protein
MSQRAHYLIVAGQHRVSAVGVDAHVAPEAGYTANHYVLVVVLSTVCIGRSIPPLEKPQTAKEDHR